MELVVRHPLGVACPVSGDGCPEPGGRVSGAQGPGDGLELLRLSLGVR